MFWLLTRCHGENFLQLLLGNEFFSSFCPKKPVECVLEMVIILFMLNAILFEIMAIK